MLYFNNCRGHGGEHLYSFKVQRSLFLCFFSPPPRPPSVFSSVSLSSLPLFLPCAVPPPFESQAAPHLEGVIISQGCRPSLPWFSLEAESCVQAALALCGHLGRLQGRLCTAQFLPGVVATGELVVKADSGCAGDAGGAGLPGDSNLPARRNL